MNWLIAHLVGDYIFQTDWMAANKKALSSACTAHVCAYMVPFLFLGLEWWQFLAIAVQHWVQDRTHIVKWCMIHITRQPNFAQAPFFQPWSLVIIDNTWHLVWLYFVIDYLPRQGFFAL